MTVPVLDSSHMLWPKLTPYDQVQRNGVPMPSPPLMGERNLDVEQQLGQCYCGPRKGFSGLFHGASSFSWKTSAEIRSRRTNSHQDIWPTESVPRGPWPLSPPSCSQRYRTAYYPMSCELEHWSQIQLIRARALKIHID